MYTEQMTQALAIVGYKPPVSMAAGTDTTITDIDMSKYRRLLVIVEVGAFGASATVDAKLRESKTSGGTYQDISGAAITQLVAAGGNNRMATIEIRAGQLDAGYQFAQLSLTVGTAATLVGAIALGGEAPHKPGNAGNLTSVAQQVVL